MTPQYNRERKSKKQAEKEAADYADYADCLATCSAEDRFRDGSICEICEICGLLSCRLPLNTNPPFILPTRTEKEITPITQIASRLVQPKDRFRDGSVGEVCSRMCSYRCRARSIRDRPLDAPHPHEP
jgi:hypothetical protein